VLPLAEVFPKVGKRSPGSVNTLNGFALVEVGLPALQDLGDIGLGLVNVAFDIHGETRSFGDRQTEVQSDASRNAAKTDEEPPHVVDGGEFGDVWFGEDCTLVCGGNNKGDKSSSYENISERQRGKCYAD
jgi:hypothetical protein